MPSESSKFAGALVQPFASSTECIEHCMMEQVESLTSYYDLGRTIGRGEFAKVKLATCRRDGSTVAIKIVQIDNQMFNCGLQEGAGVSQRLHREIQIHSMLQHAHVVSLYRVLRLPQQIVLVMEYMEGGELFDYVQGKGCLQESECRRLMVQLFSGVDYLHRHGVVHRDLKLENLLLSRSGRLVISDFGFARSYCHLESAKDSKCVATVADVLFTSCGSPCYAAPELVLDRNGYCGPPVDMWSCGVVMYAMVYGHLPFEGELPLERDESSGGTIRWTTQNVYRLYKYIHTHPLRLDHASQFSLIGQDLLLRLMDPNPDSRITLCEVWQHAWFTCPTTF